MGINVTNPIMYSIRGDLAIKFEYLIPTWERFANHYKEEEIEFLNTLKDKSALDLTLEEIEQYKKLKLQMELAKLLPKYREHNCTQEEHDIVSNFFDEYSISAFMKSRLTDEEFNNSIRAVASIKEDELSDYIQTNEENFDNLSAQETYTLYLASSRLKSIRDKELNDRIRRESQERDQALIRSLNRDYGIGFFN